MGGAQPAVARLLTGLPDRGSNLGPEPVLGAELHGNPGQRLPRAVVGQNRVDLQSSSLPGSMVALSAASDASLAAGPRAPVEKDEPPEKLNISSLHPHQTS